MLRKSRKYHEYRRYSSNGDLPWQKVTTHPKQMENFIDEQNITKHQTVSRLILWLMEEFLHQLGRLKHKQLLKDINWFAGFLPNNQYLSIFRINDPGISGRLWSQNQPNLPPPGTIFGSKSHTPKLGDSHLQKFFQRNQNWGVHINWHKPIPTWRIIPFSKWLGSPPFISHELEIWKGKFTTRSWTGTDTNDQSMVIDHQLYDLRWECISRHIHIGWDKLYTWVLNQK